MAELLLDNPGALWHQDMIDETRVVHMSTLLRIIVAIDPLVDEEGAKDEAGIIVAVLATDDHVYILDDISLHGFRILGFGRL